MPSSLREPRDSTVDPNRRNLSHFLSPALYRRELSPCPPCRPPVGQRFLPHPMRSARVVAPYTYGCRPWGAAPYTYGCRSWGAAPHTYGCRARGAAPHIYGCRARGAALPTG